MNNPIDWKEDFFKEFLLRPSEQMITFIDNLLASQNAEHQKLVLEAERLAKLVEREQLLKKIESILEDYILSSYPIADHKVIMGYVREALINQ